MELIIEGVAAIQAGVQPAGHRPEAALPPARAASSSPTRGGLTCADERKRARGARGAREPRALAGDVRRHGDAADGAVHRDVRDEPGRPEEVQRAQGRPRRRLRPVHLGADGSQSILDAARVAAIAPVAPDTVDDRSSPRSGPSAADQAARRGQDRAQVRRRRGRGRPARRAPASSCARRCAGQGLAGRRAPHASTTAAWC